MHFDGQVALYRHRAEEFERSFYSLRTMEWQLVFQTYTGYAAVAAAYVGIRTIIDHSPLVGATFLFLLAVIFVASSFLLFQVQRRMHFTRSMQNAYLTELHRVLAPQINVPQGVVVPSFPRWWAFVPQQGLSITASAAIGAYVFYTTNWHP